jgi:cytochrome c-type biogenesis protein
MSIVSVFIEGLLSFFSPCVLPLIPVYIGYLSGGTLKTTGDGQMVYDRKKVVINTIFFVIGISMAFFVLGFGISAVGRFFSGYQMIFARAGGIIIVLFGLYQLGFLGTNRILSGDYRLPVQFEKMTMSPITAILMGFVISFAWTPCIGPVLSSVLIMAATAGTSANGFGLIAVYTLGYIIPFILVGFFTNTLLNFFSKHKGVVKYSVKIGGVILIVMGLMMFTGKMNSITSYLSSVSGSNIASEATVEAKSDVVEIPDETVEEDDVVEEEPDADEAATEKIAAPDFTLTDQYGNTHSLSDYKGKIIFLNFWATWCPPCRAEMPDIQALYEEYQKMDDPDVVILGVAFPNYGKEQSVEGITQFLEENGYTYPVLMDTEASLVLPYYITAYPTTFMIDPDGNVLGYLPGGMTRDIMENVIEQAREASYK